MNSLEIPNKELYEIDNEEKFKKLITLKKLVGRGQFGKVYRAMYKDEKFIAVKLMEPNDDELNVVAEQAKVLKEINHNNIIRSYFYFHTSEIPSENQFYIGMTYVEENFENYLTRKGQLNKSESLKVATQLASALHELENRGLSHRNLKPENILVDENENILLCDFTKLKFNPTIDKATNNDNVRENLMYASPEIFEGVNKNLFQINYNPNKSDAFSYALILLKCILGCHNSQIQGLNDKQAGGENNIKYILNKNRDQIDPKILQILQNCLIFDYKKRWTFEQINSVLNQPLNVNQLQKQEKKVKKAEKLLQKGKQLYKIENKFDEAQVTLQFAQQKMKKLYGELSLENANAIYEISSFFLYKQQSKDALPLIEQNYKIVKQLVGEDHIDIAKNYLNSAKYNKQICKYYEAQNYCEKAFQIITKYKDQEQTFYADIIFEKGIALYNLGNYYKSLEFSEKALSIRKMVLGENHSDTASSYNNIGVIHTNLGNYQKSLEFKEKALSIRKMVLGENHSDTAQSYNNIGFTHNTLGNYQKALEFDEKALSIRKMVLGENHSDTATSYNNMGFTHNTLGNYQKASEFYEKALSIRKMILGENHSDTASSYNNIGATHHNLGNYQKALEFYEKALSIRKMVLGENHKDTAESYNNIGVTHDNLENYEKALEFYEKALSIREMILGEKHRDTALSYNNIGVTHNNLGNYEKSLEFHEKALSIKKMVLGENHSDTAQSYNNIGVTHTSLGNYQKSLEFKEKALSIRKMVLGENHSDTAQSYNNIGATYYYLGNYQKALEFFKQAFFIHKKPMFKMNIQAAENYLKK